MVFSNWKHQKHGAFIMNTVWQYCLQGVKYLLPLITLPYLTRVLEPSGYAVVSYTVSFMAFAQVFIEFGFNLSGTKEIANLRDGDKEANRVTGAILAARIALCLTVGIVVFFIATSIQIFRDNPLYAVLAYVATCGQALAPDFLFQGKEHMGPLTVRYLMSKGVSTALVFIMVHDSSDLLLVPIFDIVASVIALLWSFVSAQRLFGIHPVLPSPTLVVKSLKSSFLYFVTRASASALGGLTTLFVGLAITSSTQIAYWTLSLNIITAIQQMYAPIINSLYPHVVRTGDCRLVRKMGIIAIPVIIIGTMLCMVFAQSILVLLGGAAYADAAPLLRLLGLVLCFSFFCSLFGWPVLGAMGKVSTLTRNTLVSSGANLILLIIIVVAFPGNINLFAISRVASEALLCAMQIWSAKGFLLKEKQRG